MHKNNFDFLRFLFAFIVIISHIVDLTAYPDFLFLKKYFDSYLAVTGFFIISGFLICGSYVKTKDTRQYFIKRGKRLLPAYLFVIIISALLFSTVSSYNTAAYFTSPLLYKYLAANALFVNFIQPCLPGVFEHNLLCTINGALWTIKVEVAFYLVLPLLVIFIHKFERKFIPILCIYLFGILYEHVLDYGAMLYPAKQHLLEVLKHQLPGFFTFFASGIAMYYYFETFTRIKNILAPIALVIFAIEYHYSTQFLLPAAMAVLVLYVAYGFKFLNNWGKYGDFSYGIYIYHFPLIQLVVSLGLFYVYNPVLVALCIIATVLFLAFLSWNLLEKRFLKRG